MSMILGGIGALFSGIGVSVGAQGLGDMFYDIGQMSYLKSLGRATEASVDANLLSDLASDGRLTVEEVQAYHMYTDTTQSRINAYDTDLGHIVGDLVTGFNENSGSIIDIIGGLLGSV